MASQIFKDFLPWAREVDNSLYLPDILQPKGLLRVLISTYTKTEKSYSHALLPLTPGKRKQRGQREKPEHWRNQKETQRYWLASSRDVWSKMRDHRLWFPVPSFLKMRINWINLILFIPRRQELQLGWSCQVGLLAKTLRIHGQGALPLTWARGAPTQTLTGAKGWASMMKA